MLAIITGGGLGKRAADFSDNNIPKQFVEINDRPIIAYSIDKFQKSGYVNHIIVVVPEIYINQTWDIVNRYSFGKVLRVIGGGKTRQGSVYNALLAAKGMNVPPNYVSVHDAARPFVTLADIKAVSENIDETGCAIAVCAVNDTIKTATEQGGIITLNRDLLFAAQTPQGFKFKLLLEAHEQAINDGFEGSDDSALTERIGVKTKTIVCGRHNLKITEKEDLLLAAHLLQGTRM